MATQPAPDHQAQQDALVVAMAEPLLHAWGLLDLGNLRASFPRFAAAVTAVVHSYGRASAFLAAKEYTTQRAVAKVPGRFTVTPAKPAGLDQLTAELKWSTGALWSADVKAGDTKALAEAEQVTQTKVLGVAEKAVLDTSRQTLLDAVQADKQAKGWARVPEPGACSFCLLLATRGAVYKQRGTADFQVHDHCRCHVEPLFGHSYEPTAQVRAAEQLYRDSKKGMSGAAARNAFRKALAEHRAASTSLA